MTLSVPSRSPLYLLFVVLALSITSSVVGGEYLTPPSDNAPHQIAFDYLEALVGKGGLETTDLAEVVLQDESLSANNGVTHLYLKQRLDGIAVANRVINFNIDSEGRILSFGDQLIPSLAQKAIHRAPTLAAEDALGRAAEHFSLGADKLAPQQLEILRLETLRGPSQGARFTAPTLARGEVLAELAWYVEPSGAVRLTWQLELDLADNRFTGNLWVDATTGEVVAESNWIDFDTYNVFVLPKESPLDGPRTLATNPADTMASPFGWHDNDGIAGAEFTDTRGNNVLAQDDLDGNNTGGFRPDGGPTLAFDFPLDLTMPPGTYLSAAITNLFYLNNRMHDILFRYGFDEAAGNMQTLNYTGAPGGNDAVRADAQDGSGFNNANFLTPPDGSATKPRMQMFVWQAPPVLTINSPNSIAGDYDAGGADFGAPLDAIGVSGDVEVVNDGVGTATDGCEALVGFTAGKVALIDRGGCEFGLKVLNAENAGASAAIVANNQGDDVLTMGPGVSGPQVTISSVFIGQSTGDAIKNVLPATVNVTLKKVGVDRDSDLDNGIIAHEYGHGLSNRLTGGRLNVFCLDNQEQAGEGWSDLMTLLLTADGTETPTTPIGIGNYVIFEPLGGPGIRNYPYTTDLAVNPQTYADIGTTNIPHGVGEIWAAMVWEVYWRLVERDGFQKIFIPQDGGNNLTLQLIIDGLKMQICDPGFVNARDAILAADLANNGGVNECVIWKAFAKRGLGASALQGSRFVVGDETEAFDIPATCQGFLLTAPANPTAGAVNEFNLTGATPSSRMLLVGGSQQTPTTVNISGCGSLTFDVGGPIQRFDLELSTQFGDGQLDPNILAGVSGSTLHFQALDLSACTTSNVTSVAFP